MGVVLGSLAAVQAETVPGLNLATGLRAALARYPGLWAPKVFVMLMGTAMLPDLAARWLAFPEDAAHPRLAAALDSYANLCNTTGALRAFLSGIPDAARAVPPGSNAPALGPPAADFGSVRLVAPPGPALVDTARWVVSRFATANEVEAAAEAATAGRAPVVIVPVAPPDTLAHDVATFGYDAPGLATAFTDLVGAGWTPPGARRRVVPDPDVVAARGHAAAAAEAAAVTAKLRASAAPFEPFAGLLPVVATPSELPAVVATVQRLDKFVHMASFKYLLFREGKDGLHARTPVTEAGNNIGNKIGVMLLPSHCIADVDILVEAFEFEVQRGVTGVYPGRVDVASTAPSGPGFHLPLQFAAAARPSR